MSSGDDLSGRHRARPSRGVVRPERVASSGTWVWTEPVWLAGGRGAPVARRRDPEDLVLGVGSLGTGRVDGDLHVIALLWVRLAGEAQGVCGLAVEVDARAAGRVIAHEDL